MFSFFLFFSFLYSIFLIDIVIFLTMTQIWTFNLKIKHIFEYSKILPCPVLFCLYTTHEFTDSCFHLLNNVLHQFPIEPFFLSPRFWYDMLCECISAFLNTLHFDRSYQFLFIILISCPNRIGNIRSWNNYR